LKGHEQTAIEPKYVGTEGAILNAMYEVENGRYNLHSLSMQIHQDAKAGTEEYTIAVTKTREAVEKLIEQDLVQGERSKASDGIFFNDLKLTAKGQRAAIGHRKEEARFQKELPEFVERSKRVIAEMESADKKP
jgi:hypothetical protein